MRQVIHHVPDSHLNAYIRFKLALTESEPTIKPYDEKQWAELADVRLTPIEVSLSLLENLHARWTLLLRALSPAAFSKTFRHPEIGLLTLDTQLGVYGTWHTSENPLSRVACGPITGVPRFVIPAKERHPGR